jgi:hypothetical protein
MSARALDGYVRTTRISRGMAQAMHLKRATAAAPEFRVSRAIPATGGTRRRCQTGTGR